MLPFTYAEKSEIIPNQFMLKINAAKIENVEEIINELEKQYNIEIIILDRYEQLGSISIEITKYGIMSMSSSKMKHSLIESVTNNVRIKIA